MKQSYLHRTGIRVVHTYFVRLITYIIYMYHCMSMTKLSLDGLNETKTEFDNLNTMNLWISSPPMKLKNLERKKKIRTISYDNLKHTEKSCD